MSKCVALLHLLHMLTCPGDQAVENLIDEVRSHMSIMFKICEAIALLDMVRNVPHLPALMG